MWGLLHSALTEVERNRNTQAAHFGTNAQTSAPTFAGGRNAKGETFWTQRKGV